jgi:hypothetical protein
MFLEKLGINEINNRYIVESPVSGGMGAHSFQGLDNITGDKVFMKYLLFPTSTYEIAKFQSEIEATKRVTEFGSQSRGYICAEFLYSEVLYEGDIYCLITKWYSLPTLEEWLTENSDASIDVRLELVHRIFNAASYIPSGMHHRDLHPGNILIEDVSIDWHQRVTYSGIKIIDWGDALLEYYSGYEDTPDFVIELIKNGPKKIEGSYYSLPPEVFTPWGNRKAQWGKYDAWPMALLMHKILTGKDVIEHKDLGTYIEALKGDGMEYALRVASGNINNLDHFASLLLSKLFAALAKLDVKERKTLAYAGRVIWDIRIENFTPKDLNERYFYLQDPFKYIPEGGWEFSNPAEHE